MKPIKWLILAFFLLPKYTFGQNEFEIKQRTQESLQDFFNALSYVNDEEEPILPSSIAKKFGSGNYFVFNGREMKLDHFIEDYCYFDLQRHVVNHTLTFPEKMVKKSSNSLDKRWSVSAILRREYASGSIKEIADENISFTVQWRGMDEPLGLLELKFHSKPRSFTQHGSLMGESKPLTQQGQSGNPGGGRHTGKNGFPFRGGLYVGELLNESPHGQGRQTFGSKDGRLSYEGGWENGQKKGQGTMAWKDGDKYIGSWENDKMNGQGTFYYTSGAKYVGSYENGKMNGQGTYYYTNGAKYVGSYENDKKSGQGTYYWANGDRYEGNWENGKMNGQGTYYYTNGAKYVGSYENDKKSGQGTYYWANGDRYEGNWENDKKNGQGTYYWANGNRYEGNWENGKMNGQGTFYYTSGAKYVGSYENDKKSGQGTYYWANGDRYEGNWENDKMNGQGTYYYTNGDYERGSYVSGKQHGTWIKRNSNGTIIRTQIYENGVVVRTE